MIVYPVNNDKIIPSNGEVRKGLGMTIKDAKGKPIINVVRYYFGNGKESRERAVAFTRHLVEIINEKGMVK